MLSFAPLCGICYEYLLTGLVSVFLIFNVGKVKRNYCICKGNRVKLYLVFVITNKIATKKVDRVSLFLSIHLIVYSIFS